MNTVFRGVFLASDHPEAIAKFYEQVAPNQVLSEAMVRDVFHLESRIITDPLYGTPMCLPISRSIRTAH